ncbi:MAG: hypothetical protein WC821_05325 [archaeon]|jgi:hypothetical protein
MPNKKVVPPAIAAKAKERSQHYAVIKQNIEKNALRRGTQAMILREIANSNLSDVEKAKLLARFKRIRAQQ